MNRLEQGTRVSITHVNKLDATIAAQQQQIEALREALRDVEWGGSDQFGAHCPDCGNYKHTGAHLPDCKLAALLAVTPGKTAGAGPQEQS